MNPRNFFAELKRRNVYKVAVAYAVVGWLLIQVTTQVFPFFEIPNWAVRLVVLVIVVGFPVALLIAWAFELTPEGLKRTEAAEQTFARSGSRTWIYVVTIGSALALALFFLGRYSALKERSLSASSDKSIAVLPFENLSEDKSNAYFADGITRDGGQSVNRVNSSADRFPAAAVTRLLNPFAVIHRLTLVPVTPSLRKGSMKAVRLYSCLARICSPDFAVTMSEPLTIR